MGIKDTLQKQLEANLETWRQQIEEAETKARAARAEAEADKARAELEKSLWTTVENLRGRARDAEAWLAKLKDSTEEEAEKARARIESLVA
jgi:hypothetical protein